MANRVKKDRSAIRKARKADRSYKNQTYRSKVEINEDNIGYLNEMSIRIDVKKVAEDFVPSEQPKQEQQTKQQSEEKVLSLTELFEKKVQKIHELKSITDQARKTAEKLAEVKQQYGKNDEDRILDGDGNVIKDNVIPMRQDEELAI